MSDQQAHGVPHIHVQLVDAERVQAHGPSQPAAQPLSHATHASVMPAHHDPHAPLKSDAVRHGMHDGTMYAQGATGEPYDGEAPAHASVGQRVKEALPGTKEHKAKKEAEGNLAVYS